MKNSQSGFTLIELLLTIAITGVLFSAIGAVVYQMSSISSRGNSELTVWHELENVNSRLIADCQAAREASGGNSLTLTYPGGESVVYSLSGAALTRASSAGVNTLAGNISDLSFHVSGRQVTMSITSTISGRSGSSEQITSVVVMRPAGP